MPDPNAVKRALLTDTFRCPSFRPGQETLIDGLLSGRDVLGILPTGGGKSLCYQLPALMLPGTALIVSPLISLMEDQVAALKRKGIPAAALTSAIPRAEQDRILARAAAGAFRLLYAAPERLLTERFLRFARSARLSFLCADEAHCVSQWGRDFRPSYLSVRPFREMLIQSGRHLPLAAFTATATPEIASDIISLLGLRSPLRVTSGFDRPNLSLELAHPADKRRALLNALRERPSAPAIVYCRTRQSAEAVAAFLKHSGIPALLYHAGMDPQARHENELRFLRDRAPVMAATNAFGMGIDRPDVRLVVHLNMPGDPESYYQEAGRAGRDGLPARCLLLANHRDLILGRFFLKHRTDPALREEGRIRLHAMRRYASGKYCLRQILLAYFGETSRPCGRCSVCLKKSGAIRAAPPGVPDPDLLRDLTDLRFRLAKEKGLSPHRVCPDAFLRDLAAARPASPAALLSIEGAPLSFALRYGAPFLREIREFLECRIP